MNGTHLSDGDLATLRTYLRAAADTIERGYALEDRGALVASLRALVTDLTTPEMNARRDEMLARLAASRA